MEKRERTGIIIAGAVIGAIGALMVLFGNPKNMGFCIACFIRDTAILLKSELSRPGHVRYWIRRIFLPAARRSWTRQ